MTVNKNYQQLIKELQSVFKESENNLSFLHKKKLDLISKFSKAQNETLTADILQQIKDLK